MDVTRQNFQEIISEAQKTINDAAFFVIDGEFTGVDAENNITAFDTPEEYYQKVNRNSKNFILIQLGLTAFRVDENNPEKFMYKSYNFYVYPRGRKHVFKCQGQSLAFLAENGFDFNKLFKDGISFATVLEAEKLRDRMLEKNALILPSNTADKSDSLNTSNFIPVPDTDKEWLSETEQQIEEFLKSDEKELSIENRNGFQRKLIYQLIEMTFRDRVSTESRSLENNRRALVIKRKLSEEEEKLLAEERLRKAEMELQDEIGISVIMRLVSESRKLIVGHNMLLDVIYILRQCFGPTPDDFNEFKHFAREIFPNLLDTKYLCSLEKFKTNINSSVLAHAYESVSKSPFKIPIAEAESDAYAYSMDNRQEHNAGFDSYMTGLIFLSLTNYLDIKPIELEKDNKSLRKIKNRIFCMRLQDPCYINMIGTEPQPQRDHVFHIEFPVAWKQSDIVNHFREFGSVYISWITDTTAMVALNQRENAPLVLKGIGYLSGVKVKSYNDFKTLTTDNSTNLATESGTKMTRTPVSKLVVENLKNRKRQHSDSPNSLPTAAKKMFKEVDNW